MTIISFMRPIFLSFLLAIVFVLSGTAQVIDTVQANYEWERPSVFNAPTLSIARTENRLFAGTINGLFYSEDDGEAWKSIPELYANNIESVVATGNTVIATYKKVTQSIPGSQGVTTYFSWISKDEGMTIDTVLRLSEQSGGFFSHRVSHPFIFKENSFGQFHSTKTLNYSYAKFFLWTETNGTWNGMDSTVSTDTLFLFRPLSAGIENDVPYYTVVKNGFLFRHFFDENTGTVLSVDSISSIGSNSHFSGDTIIFPANNYVSTSTDYGDSFSTINYPQLDPFNTKSFFDATQNRSYFQFDHIIFRQNNDDPSILDTIFTPFYELSTNEEIYFFIDKDYLWVHTSGRLYRSEKENIVWTEKDKGITNSFNYSGHDFSKIGEEFWITGSGSEGTYVLSDAYSEPLYLDTELLDIQQPITKIGNRYLSSIDGVWHWSLDAITYESYEIPKQLYSPLVKQIDGTYYILENDRMLFTNDLAETFDSISIPDKGELFVKGDTMVIFEGNTVRHLSADAGNTWTSQEIEYPFSISSINPIGSWIHWHNDTLYVFHDFNSFYFSTDWGDSWTDPTPGEWFFFFHTNPIIRNRVVAAKDSLVLAHIEGDLWATTNFGASWTILEDVPFSCESYNIISSFVYSYYRLNGALKYHITNDNIYAFTKGYGVQRTPVADLLAAMAPPAFADLELSATGPDEYKVYEPIPYQITVANKGTTNATEVVIRVPLPNTVVYTSDVPSSGSYNLFYEEWTIDSLAAGEQDTLHLTLFPLMDDSEITFFTQIIHAEMGQNDYDSTPDNNSLEEVPAEDDEAVVVSVPNVLFALENSISSRSAIFPNPATDVLYFSPQIGSLHDIQIISMDGEVKKTVKMELSPHSVIEFDIQDLPKGGYFLNVSSSEQVFTIPFIKE